MDVDIENEYLIGVYSGVCFSGKMKFQPIVINNFIKVVNIMKSLPRIEALYKFNSLHYKKLAGDKSGLSSVRITDQYRLEFLEIGDSKGIITRLTILALTNHYK
jgi:proteic killer suppression protein